MYLALHRRVATEKWLTSNQGWGLMMPILKCNGFYSAQNLQTKLVGMYLFVYLGVISALNQVKTRVWQKRGKNKKIKINEQENFSNKKNNPESKSKYK